jgi:hypothetical protein
LTQNEIPEYLQASAGINTETNESDDKSQPRKIQAPS